MNPLKALFFVFDLIRDESAPWQISMAVVLGAFIAVSPTLSPQIAVALLILCVLRINILALTFSVIFFSLVTMPLEGWFDELGRWVLVDVHSLRRVWAGLYHWPVFPFTQFNNTIVMGGLVAFVTSAIPIFVISYVGYRFWGYQLLSRIQQSNLGLALRATLIFRRYADHTLKR